MKNYFKIFLFYFLFASVSNSQSDLFIPRNVLEAYENGTRSYDGKPGENYWQNSADYEIKATIEPATRMLKGSEKIVYYNNSPDTLSLIVFNIIQDLNRYESERGFPISREALSEGVKLEKFLINDIPLQLEKNENVRRRNTLMTIRIDDNPLAPGSSMNFEIEWNFIIPKGRNPRMGAYDSTTFFVAYWFPQVAVYDDIDGWDVLAHTGEHEFYNDFSNFGVEITVPNTFGIWATGILQNPEEVLTAEYLERYKNSRNSDEIINIVTKEELNSGSIYNSSNENNIWRYKSENITDFAFGTSDHYLWDATSIVVDKNSGRRAYVAAVYKEESEDFYEVAELAKKSIEYFSNELPGVPYPYPCLTVFNGRGGMEFPMIVNDGSEELWARTVGVTSHEIAHQYFPFYVGTNEKKYGWMDEGMATFLPFEFQAMEGKYNPQYNALRFYERMAGTEMELPMMIPTYQLRGWTENMSIYYRPAFAYYFLRDALGKETFDNCLKEYIERWKGKHPVPFDFFFTFNEVAGKDLSWYWKPWFYERGVPDLSIKEAVYSNEMLEITIEKIGIIPTPVKLSIISEDNSVLEIYKSAAIWEENKTTAIIKKELSSLPVSITLGSDMIPDVNRANNIFIFSAFTY